MSLIASTLASVEPWSQATLASADVCIYPVKPFWGVNDKKSAMELGLDLPIFVEGDEATVATANFQNTNGNNVAVLKYGEFVGSINAVKRPSQCDFIIYSRDTNGTVEKFLLAEVKVCKKSKRGDRRKDAKAQLAASAKDIVRHVPNVASAVDKRCVFFHCCKSTFVQKPYVPPKARQAAQGVRRVVEQGRTGIQYNVPDIESQGFCYFEFPYGHIYTFS